MSLPVFCSRLKTHLFSRSFRWLHCCACEETLVITDTFIAVFTYLLAYTIQIEIQLWILLVMTERVNYRRAFIFLCTCERRRVQRVIPWFIYLGVMSFIGSEVMETAWGWRILWKKSVNIYHFCRVEKRLIPSHKMNDMKILLVNFHQKSFRFFVYKSFIRQIIVAQKRSLNKLIWWVRTFFDLSGKFRRTEDEFSTWQNTCKRELFVSFWNNTNIGCSGNKVQWA